MITGILSCDTSDGTTDGSADFNFSVFGPKRTARANIEANCRNGKWHFRAIEATPASAGRSITLTVIDIPSARLIHAFDGSESPLQGSDSLNELVPIRLEMIDFHFQG